MNEISSIFDKTYLNLKKLEELEKMPDPEHTYIIAITPRSGSSYLSDVITKTKQLGRPGEFLSQAVIQNVVKTIPGKNSEQYLRNVMRFRKTRNHVSGIKASWFQFRNFQDSMVDKSQLLKFKYIYLTRKDLNAQAVSLYRATATTVFHTNIEHSEEALKKLNTLQYDYTQIKNWYLHIVEQEKGWKKFFQNNNISPLTIYYEDIDDDISKVLKRIAKYLGISVNNKVLLENNSIFEKVSDNRNVDWAQQFAIEYALETGLLLVKAHDIAIQLKREHPALCSELSYDTISKWVNVILQSIAARIDKIDEGVERIENLGSFHIKNTNAQPQTIFKKNYPIKQIKANKSK
jgi:LPS sulfotransferase NodH